jgi:hypothetical protein
MNANLQDKDAKSIREELIRTIGELIQMVDDTKLSSIVEHVLQVTEM